jgi:intracellular septation protein A
MGLWNWNEHTFKEPERMNMGQKSSAIAKFIFGNFGPLIIFYGVNHFYGLKPAIALSTLYSFGEIAYKVYRKERITNLFKFSASITLVFGVIDLYAQQSIVFKFESTVTNILTGLFFAASVFGDKTLLQEFYEQRKDAKTVKPELAAYLRFLTWVWVVYFFLKAAAYFWIAQHYTIEQGLLIRIVVGSGSFYALLAISIFGSKHLFHLLKKFGFFKQEVLEGV